MWTAASCTRIIVVVGIYPPENVSVLRYVILGWGGGGGALRMRCAHYESGRGGAYSFVVCLGQLIIGHASLSRRIC